MKYIHGLTFILTLNSLLLFKSTLATTQVSPDLLDHSQEPKYKIQKLMPTLNFYDLSEIAAQAQYYLGVQCRQGIDIPKDLNLAFDYIKSAAEQNCLQAQYDLYLMYKNGLGTQTDVEQAVLWCQKAADCGHASAQNDYGFMLEFGNHYVAQNKDLAIEYYEKALHQNYSLALDNLERILDSQ